jgi:nucleoside-diphosphate-sugar epimerase
VWYALCSQSAKLDSSAITAALGWKPLMPPFIDGIETYYEAWRNSSTSAAAH